MPDWLTVDDIVRLHIDNVTAYRFEKRDDPVPVRVEMHPELWDAVRRNPSDHWRTGQVVPGQVPWLGVPVVVRHDFIPGTWRIVYEDGLHATTAGEKNHA